MTVSRRWRYAQFLRAWIGGLVLASTALNASSGLDSMLAGAYLVLILIAESASRIHRGWLPTAHVSMLFADVCLLGVVMHFSGGADSLAGCLVLVHVVSAVALYRTIGLVIAAGHTISIGIFCHAWRPVASRSGAFAGLSIQSSSAFDQSIEFVIAALTLAVVLAMYSAIRERDLRRRQYELEAMRDLAIALENAVDARSVALTLLEHACDSFDLGRSLVLGVIDSEWKVLAHNTLSAGEGVEVLVASSGILSRASREGRPISVMELDPDSDRELASLMPSASNIVVIPFNTDGRKSSSAILTELGEALDFPVQQRLIRALSEFAAYAALALANGLLLEQVGRLAAVDGLTQIANRRTFESVLHREVTRASKDDRAVSLVLIDIDNFKAVNDTYGHPAGGDLLRNVAAVITIECSDSDLTACYGGDEFAVILPDCPASQSVVIAERLRRLVSAAPSAALVTASAGVATFPEHARSAEGLVQSADEALYRSKRAGRDRLTQAELVGTEPA